MIHEYAVSPSLFAHPGNLALLFQAFEAGSGRLICDFPRRKWLQYAREFIKRAIDDQVDQRACIELLMGLEKKRVFLERQGPSWDENKNWINNAIDEHCRWKFHAILNDKSVPAEPDVIGYGPAMAGHPRWSNPGTCSVPRQAPALVKSAADLIDVSTALVLVDRNFIPSEARFLNVLAAFGEHVRDAVRGRRITQIKYVTAYEKDRNSFQSPQFFEQNCALFVPSVIPKGIEVKFIVKTKTLLHKRLAMTDRAAILFEHGLDEGPGEVLLARLAVDDFEKEWSQWDKQVMHSFTVVGTKN
jgi:hypothetical protein